jgi:DNA-binding GntR family transcriptional regulator
MLEIEWGPMDRVERQASAARVKQVANALEEEIVLGWLQPRERLIEEDIAGGDCGT